MKISKYVRASAIALVSIAFCATKASAITFAAFQETDGDNTVFTANPSGGFSSSVIPVTFEFEVPNTYGPAGGIGDDIAADLYITSDPLSYAGVDTTGSGNSYQSFTAFNYDFVDLSGNTLLNVVSSQTGATFFYDPTLSGQGQSANLTATNSPTANRSGDVSYSSAYLNFTNPPSTEDNFAWSFSNVIDTVDGSDGPTYDPSTGTIEAFTANVTGTLAATPSPGVTVAPELSPAIAIGIAALSLGGLLMFRKRQGSNLA